MEFYGMKIGQREETKETQLEPEWQSEEVQGKPQIRDSCDGHISPAVVRICWDIGILGMLVRREL